MGWGCCALIPVECSGKCSFYYESPFQQKPMTGAHPVTVAPLVFPAQNPGQALSPEAAVFVPRQLFDPARTRPPLQHDWFCFISCLESRSGPVTGSCRLRAAPVVRPCQDPAPTTTWLILFYFLPESRPGLVTGSCRLRAAPVVRPCQDPAPTTTWLILFYFLPESRSGPVTRSCRLCATPVVRPCRDPTPTTTDPNLHDQLLPVCTSRLYQVNTCTFVLPECLLIPSTSLNITTIKKNTFIHVHVVWSNVLETKSTLVHVSSFICTNIKFVRIALLACITNIWVVNRRKLIVSIIKLDPIWIWIWILIFNSAG